MDIAWWKRRREAPEPQGPSIAGIALRLGDREYVVPPLNFAALKTLLPRIEEMGALGLNPTCMALVLDCSLAALRRNYPAITRADIEQAIDVANFGDVFNACMDVSGLLRKEQAGAGERAPGESTGTTFTPD